jgi:EAL domain-containing protein (putative c-di-GMP-specific phosphodiesterase class I)
VGAIVSLGHGLGLEVVAEGVENAEQVRALTAMECDQGQGFFFARPLAAEALSELLRGEAAD